MQAIFLVLLASTTGIEVGWEPLAEGGHEYTIQLEPGLLELLQRGNDITSLIPPQIDVRRYRITVGNGALPRIDGTPRSADLPQSPVPMQAEPSFPLKPVEMEGAVRRASSAHPEIPAEHSLPKAGAAKSPDFHGTSPAGMEKHETGKPSLDGGVNTHLAPEANTPWLPFFAAMILLCLSLGANVYLGWIAADARSKYREALLKYRATPLV